MRNATSMYSGAEDMYESMHSNLRKAKEELSFDDLYHELDHESRANLNDKVSNLRKAIKKLASLSPEERIRAILHLTKGEENEMKNLVKGNLLKEIKEITSVFKFKL